MGGANGETNGFIKIVAKENSGKILGGHIIGMEASTLIHELAAAMKGKIIDAEIGSTFHDYLTLSDGIRYACQRI